MNSVIYQSIKKRNAIEIIISSISILVGVTLIYNLAYLIYAYHFTSILFYLMLPMTTLISELIIGLFLTFSGFYLLTNNRKLTLFNKLTGLLIVIYSLNQILLAQLRYEWNYDSLIYAIVLPVGVFLYLFMRQKKYTILEVSYHRLVSDKIKLTIGLSVFLMIDILFYSWDYTDRFL